MKKIFTKKTTLCLLLAMVIITLLQCVSLATSENLQMIKKGEKDYIIYVSGLLDEEFEFAFANNADEVKGNLVFTNSAKDSLENGNNIAYTDSTLYDEYFKDKENTYIWVKKGTEYKLEAVKVTLTEALSEEEVQSLNQATKTIEVKVGEKKLPQEVVDGVKITRKIGTLKIKDAGLKNVQYQMFKAAEGTDVAELVRLANEMNALEGKNIFEKLSIYNEFKDIYASLKPTVDDADWKNVEDNTILQPQDSKNGEQYLVWIKAEDQDANVITDIQIMTCKDEATKEYKKQPVEGTPRMPITGDSIVLFVIAAIVIALIVVVSILKVRDNKKNRNA